LLGTRQAISKDDRKDQTDELSSFDPPLARSKISKMSATAIVNKAKTITHAAIRHGRASALEHVFWIKYM
jgi:hypothetical protein